MFTILNLELQKDEPMVQRLDEKLNLFLKGIMLRFVKPLVIKTSPELHKCNYKDTNNQRADGDLIVGQEVRDFMSSHEFTSTQLDNFYLSAI